MIKEPQYNEPKGMRALFWKVWGFWFDVRLKIALKQIENSEGRLDPKEVEKLTFEFITMETEKLLEGGAIEVPMVYWKGAWIESPELRK